MSIVIIINNYLHDMATGFAMASAVLMLVLYRQALAGAPEDLATLRRVFPTLTFAVRLSLAWIIIGGVPRLIFFTRYEWDPAVVKGIVPALGLKHMLMFAVVIAGVFLWRRVGRLLRAEAEV